MPQEASPPPPCEVVLAWAGVPAGLSETPQPPSVVDLRVGGGGAEIQADFFFCQCAPGRPGPYRSRTPPLRRASPLGRTPSDPAMAAGYGHRPRASQAESNGARSVVKRSAVFYVWVCGEILLHLHMCRLIFVCIFVCAQIHMNIACAKMSLSL